MDDQQASNIHQVVSIHLRNNPEVNLLNPGHFPALVDEIYRQVGFDEDSNKTQEFYNIVAMCAVGPDRCAPTNSMRNEFLNIVETHSVGGLDRILEIAVAFGCGKWRKIKSAEELWEQQWPKALWLLVRALEPAVEQANRWLSKHVVGYFPEKTWNTESDRETIQRDASLLAIYITESLNPLHLKQDQKFSIVCHEDHTLIEVLAGEYYQHLQPGARSLVELNSSALLQKVPDQNNKSERDLPEETQVNILAREDEIEIKFSGPPKQVSLKINDKAELSSPVELSIWQCCCGNKNCKQRHRLDSWVPSDKVDLWSFLASSVKGPDTKFKVNTFSTGMYYPLLVKEGMMKIRKVFVEFSFCQNKDCDSQDKTFKYEGDRCPKCKTVFDETKSHKIMEERFIVAGDHSVYERQARIHCTVKTEKNGKKTECENLYIGLSCPLCGGRQKVRRPTIVWRRSFNDYISLDQLDVKDRDWIENKAQTEDYDEQEDDDSYWCGIDDSVEANIGENSNKVGQGEGNNEQR